MALFHPRWIAGLARHAALIGVGGRTWTAIVATGDGYSDDRRLRSDGTRTLFIVRNLVDKARISAALTPIFTADWLAIGAADLDLTAEMTLVSVSTPTLAFKVDGTPAIDHGYLLAPLSPTAVPALAAAQLRRLRQGTQLGTRQGF